MNVNKASAGDMVLVLGLSKDMADRIVINRPYRVKGELVAKNVVPKETFDMIKDRISVSPVETWRLEMIPLSATGHPPRGGRPVLPFQPAWSTADAGIPLVLLDTMASPVFPLLEPDGMRRSVLILAVLVIGLAIAGYVFFNGERKAPVRYRSASVERGPVISLVTATGSINPVVSVQVGTQVSGMIKSLHADFNSVVKTGDIVAVIDPEPFKARRDQAVEQSGNGERQTWHETRTELAQRKREVDRAKSLIAQQFVSQNDVDVAITNCQGAEAQVNVSMAQVRQAEAALNAAELDLKYTT